MRDRTTGTILDEIAAYTRGRVAEEKAAAQSEIGRRAGVGDELQAYAGDGPEVGAGDFDAAADEPGRGGGFPFERALATSGLSFICEVKKASPSRGVIAEDFPYVEIARSYEAAGAAAVSVLTEPRWFRGSAEHLREIAASVDVPVLRKDFIVDEYQIREAARLGAAAVLLIVSILTDGELANFLALADGLGISALVEAHDEKEVGRAVAAGARVIGVNNRDLRTFDVDAANSLRLRTRVPNGVLFVSESGVTGPDDIRLLADARPDAVLIGEAMMRARDRSAFLRALREAASWNDGGMKQT